MITQLITSFSGQVTLVLTGLAILSACSTQPESQAQHHISLDNTQWVLQEMQQQKVNNKRALTLDFQQQRVSGFAGCNRLMSRFTASHDGIMTITQPSVTRMFCTPQINQLETNYLQSLSQVNMYAITRNSLVLMDGKRQPLLSYKPAKK